MTRLDLWFPVFNRDYLADAKVAALPTKLEGVLLRLWCVHNEAGSLPNDASALLQMLKRDVTLDELNQVLRTFFELDEDGQRWRSPRMARERAKAEEKYAAKVARITAAREKREAGLRAKRAAASTADAIADIEAAATADVTTDISTRNQPDNHNHRYYPTTPPPPPAGESDVSQEEDANAAFVWLLESLPNPAAMRAELRAMVTGMPGHPHVDLDTLRRAVADLRIKTPEGQAPDLEALRAFVRRAANGAWRERQRQREAEAAAKGAAPGGRSWLELAEELEAGETRTTGEAC